MSYFTDHSFSGVCPVLLRLTLGSDLPLSWNVTRVTLCASVICRSVGCLKPGEADVRFGHLLRVHHVLPLHKVEFSLLQVKKGQSAGTLPGHINIPFLLVLSGSLPITCVALPLPLTFVTLAPAGPGMSFSQPGLLALCCEKPSLLATLRAMVLRHTLLSPAVDTAAEGMSRFTRRKESFQNHTSKLQRPEADGRSR